MNGGGSKNSFMGRKTAPSHTFIPKKKKGRGKGKGSEHFWRRGGGEESFNHAQQNGLKSVTCFSEGEKGTTKTKWERREKSEHNLYSRGDSFWWREGVKDELLFCKETEGGKRRPQYSATVGRKESAKQIRPLQIKKRRTMNIYPNRVLEVGSEKKDACIKGREKSSDNLGRT